MRRALGRRPPPRRCVRAFSALAGASSFGALLGLHALGVRERGARLRAVLALPAPLPRPRASASQPAGTASASFTSSVGARRQRCVACDRRLARRSAVGVRQSATDDALWSLRRRLLRSVGLALEGRAAARRPRVSLSSSARRTALLALGDLRCRSRAPFARVGDLDRASRARASATRNSPSFSCSATSPRACCTACAPALRPIASM